MEDGEECRVLLVVCAILKTIIRRIALTQHVFHAPRVSALKLSSSKLFYVVCLRRKVISIRQISAVVAKGHQQDAEGREAQTAGKQKPKCYREKHGLGGNRCRTSN